jgi:hypothetical protein
MASRSFRVVFDDLDRVAGDLDRLADRFASVAQKRVGYSGYADAHAAEEGLSEFFGKWTDGMEKLHKQLADVAGRLHHAADDYKATERQLTDAARV